jgi:hypothetical protein
MSEPNPDWPVPIPESEWTPWQREVMRGVGISYTRQKQQAHLAGWAKRQRQAREWICFADIADWCARRPGSVARDEHLRVQAGSDLLQAVQGGEFNRAGRLCVAYIPPWDFACPEPIRFRLDIGRVRWPMRVDDLAYLWAPANLCARWFAARPDIAPMPGLMTAALAARPSVASPATGTSPPGKVSAITIRNFVATYVTKVQGQQGNPTQVGLLKTWKAASYRGHRAELIAALRDKVEPQRGRPPRTRGN